MSVVCSAKGQPLFHVDLGIIFADGVAFGCGLASARGQAPVYAFFMPRPPKKTPKPIPQIDVPIGKQIARY
jgi:hypothetical protein